MQEKRDNDIVSAVEQFIRNGAPPDPYTEEEVAELVGPDDEEVVGVELYLKVTANLKVKRGTPTEQLQQAYGIMQWSDWRPDHPDSGEYLDWYVEMKGFNLLSGPVMEGQPGRSVVDCYGPSSDWQLLSANMDIKNGESEEEF